MTGNIDVLTVTVVFLTATVDSSFTVDVVVVVPLVVVPLVVVVPLIRVVVPLRNHPLVLTCQSLSLAKTQLLESNFGIFVAQQG